jgi:protein-S-isoprenylcysteine O-methyltransferase Ste14
MRTLFDAVRTLAYVTGFVFLWGWMALGVRKYDRSLGFVLPSWMAKLGVAFMLIGGMIVLLSVGTFVVRGRGTPAPFDAPRQFVAVGPYRYVRNPMYIGAWTVLSGFGLYLHSLSILLMALAALLLAHLFVIFHEEPTLRVKFGAPYVSYCTSVSRWIPKGARPKRNRAWEGIGSISFRTTHFCAGRLEELSVLSVKCFAAQTLAYSKTLQTLSAHVPMCLGCRR